MMLLLLLQKLEYEVEMYDIIILSRERRLFYSPAYSRHSVLSPRSLDKSLAKQDGGFMFGATMLKQCTKCKQWKLKSEFHKNKSTKDGINRYCKLCGTEMSRKWASENPEKVHKNEKEWRLKNPERKREHRRKYREAHFEKVRSATRKWLAENRERINQWHREWCLNNKEKRCTSVRKWQIANPEKARVYRQNHLALKNSNGGKITTQEWQWLREFYNFTCLKCGRKEPEIKLTLDHVKPLKLGGKNIIENAQPLCNSCNASKGAREIDYR